MFNATLKDREYLIPSNVEDLKQLTNKYNLMISMKNTGKEKKFKYKRVRLYWQDIV